MRCPADAAQDEQAKGRIIERPRVMTRDRNEDSTTTIFSRPDQRLLNVLFTPAGQRINRLLVADELPIAFVIEMQLGKAGGDRVCAEMKIEIAMAEFGSISAPGQADSSAQGIDVFVAIHCVMQINQATAPLLEPFQFGGARLIPSR